ncbi:MAG: hypothetical protein HZA01_14745 [Nitrospinae bacterium]|nr:hypothetical protein [Nitrospinota bacterium]
MTNSLHWQPAPGVPAQQLPFLLPVAYTLDRNQATIHHSTTHYSRPGSGPYAV